MYTSHISWMCICYGIGDMPKEAAYNQFDLPIRLGIFQMWAVSDGQDACNRQKGGCWSPVARKYVIRSTIMVALSSTVKNVGRNATNWEERETPMALGIVMRH
ncbi:hypothetical protein M514_02704 [Trichuris suis]|uniref:Uncharacterized protein n=1 Tax=Trichuris suis TaxID=68888 RepID=A0A085NNT0_9BILA|nr:hypothetical protein M513_02704 [Trichuris suis]KFD71126.1 hypothetical protein M514_02704 [Trichuris suis]